MATRKRRSPDSAGSSPLIPTRGRFIRTRLNRTDQKPSFKEPPLTRESAKKGEGKKKKKKKAPCQATVTEHVTTVTDSAAFSAFFFFFWAHLLRLSLLCRMGVYRLLDIRPSEVVVSTVVLLRSPCWPGLDWCRRMSTSDLAHHRPHNPAEKGGGQKDGRSEGTR